MTAICIKYRLLPTKAQVTVLDQTLDLCRQVYNSLVGERTAVYEMQGRTLTMYDQIPNLRRWKEAHPELLGVHSQVLQNVAVRVDLAFEGFFRRVKAAETPGYPRMKGRGVYDSITFPQAPSGCKLVGERLHLSKIGHVRCVVHRPIVGTPKTCTVRRQAGKWFACFCCEYEPEPLPESSEKVGIDIGLEKFAALSDGTFVENPRFFRRDEKALAKAGRKQARTHKGSRERRKANKVLSRIHERIRNRRHNFVHQLARRLVHRYRLIAVEKLNVRGMVKNHCLAKSISDASWSQFRTVLTQKAESAARQIVEVNPAYTSQMCSRCGNVAKKPLRERWHFCPVCSLSLDRDTNAAINILKTALKPAVGQHSVASALA
jgi:putative transposase